MLTASELGRLAARVKMAGASASIGAATPKPIPEFSSDFESELLPKFPTSSRTGRIKPIGEPVDTNAPIFGSLFNPSENKAYGDPTLRGSAAKFVPQKDFPYAGKDLTGNDGPKMDMRTYQTLLAKHYSNHRPFGFNVPPSLLGPLSEYLPQQAFSFHPGDERHETYSAANALYRDPSKAPQKQEFEKTLKNMKDIAFKQRTSRPFYYDEYFTDPGVRMGPIGANVESAQIMNMPPDSAWQNPPDNSAIKLLNKNYPSVGPDSARLHEHVHTTQSVPTRMRRDEVPRTIFGAELPAVLSESAHVADAYHKATGQWPKGEIMGMPYSAFVEDLRRRGHLGGSTQMSAVMNDPKYRAQIQKMIDVQHGKFEQQDALADAYNGIMQNPRVALLGTALATAGTPVSAPLNMLNNLLPPGAWGEETKRSAPAYSGVVGKRTTSSPPSQRKYDADGKAIPSGNINKPTTSSPPRQNKYDADGKAIQ